MNTEISSFDEVSDYWAWLNLAKYWSRYLRTYSLNEIVNVLSFAVDLVYQRYSYGVPLLAPSAFRHVCSSVAGSLNLFWTFPGGWLLGLMNQDCQKLRMFMYNVEADIGITSERLRVMFPAHAFLVLVFVGTQFVCSTRSSLTPRLHDAPLFRTLGINSEVVCWPSMGLRALSWWRILPQGFASADIVVMPLVFWCH